MRDNSRRSCRIAGNAAGSICMVVLMSTAFWLGVPAAASQEHHEDTSQHRNTVAPLAGVTREGRRDNEPSVGIEYERLIGLRLGVGALIEHTFTDEDFTVFALPIAFHFDRLKLFAAPGIEGSEFGSETLPRLGAEYAFEQRLFSPDRHGDGLPMTLQNALAALKSGDTSVAGDPTLLPGSLELTSAPQIARTFSEEFVAALDDQPPGEWAGPVRSVYGLHLVRIEQREPGYLPSVEEIRPALEHDLIQAQSEEAKLEFYEALRARYDVRIVADPQMAGERTPD